MQFVTLGATDQIGASCHFLQIDGTGVALDAGAHPGRSGPESLPDFDQVHRRSGWYVDHVLVTHAHHDHLGTLPVLIRHFPHVQVHMTPATQALAEFLLPASARLQQRKLDEGSTEHQPLFDEEELETYSYLYLDHPLEKPFEVTAPAGETPVTARFLDAGHILGSAGTLLTFPEDGGERRLFYTSDTNTEGQAIIPGGSYPEAPIDVLLLETTLGDDPEADRTTRGQEEEKLSAALQRVLGRGGTALVPVFVMGRAQEVLALIDRFKRRGDIAQDVPVYTAGSMRSIASLYDQTRRSTPRLNPDFKVFDVDQEDLPYDYQAVGKALAGPSIHVVSSGMMFENTLSNRLARRLVEDEKNAILRVGYAKEGSAAARLQAAADNGAEVILSTERGPQPVRADVERFRLSGHSNRGQLLGLARRLQPDTILLVHGETEAKDWMEENLREVCHGTAILRPEQGEVVRV